MCVLFLNRSLSGSVAARGRKRKAWKQSCFCVVEAEDGITQNQGDAKISTKGWVLRWEKCGCWRSDWESLPFYMGLNIHCKGKVRTRTYILTAGETLIRKREAFASAKWEESFKKEDIFPCAWNSVQGYTCYRRHASQAYVSPKKQRCFTKD